MSRLLRGPWIFGLRAGGGGGLTRRPVLVSLTPFVVLLSSYPGCESYLT